MSDTLLPTDQFSRRLRELSDNPGAIRRTSTVQTADFYGNVQTWVIDTFRDGAKEEVLVQRIDSQGGIQLVLPPAVTAVLMRQRESAVGVSRRRAAQTALATKLRRGIDPAAALKRHRKAAK
jgi:hypothetical protein